MTPDSSILPTRDETEEEYFRRLENNTTTKLESANIDNEEDWIRAELMHRLLEK